MTVEELIILHEGERLHPYRCPAGRLTIGVGRNIEDNGISRDESRMLLRNDIERSRRELSTFAFSRKLCPVREAVLLDMLFNLGLTRFKSFRKMLVALGQGDYNKAAEEMVNSFWYNQVGNRAKRLVEMMRTGEWPV